MKKSKGFSLIELMIVLSIAGIVLMTGVPAFTTTISDNRLSSQAKNIRSSIALARSEAAKRSNFTITLCPTLDGTSCIESASWDSGWIVLVDLDGDRVLDPDDGDRVVRHQNKLSGDNTLRTIGFDSANFLQFSSDGMPSSSGTFIVCDKRGTSSAKAVIISVAGQTRLAVDENSDGISNSHNGRDENISCPA